LDFYLNLVHDQLLERYKWQCSAYGRQFPFILKNNMVMGTENIDFDSHMNEVLKHGSLSIGFIGLAETLKELIGAHHGESKVAQDLGISIIKHMRDFTDQCTIKENLNFSLFSSPSEGLSGRFTSIDKKEFGVIVGVTDKEYYTNSSHIPVYFKISAAEKIRLEAPYHALTNAGHIAYVEMDGDPRKNTLAFASVVVEMWKNNIGYGAINHAVDRCQKCSFEGIIDEACPNCGESTFIDRIRRITGYLVGTVDRWNSYKLAELRDRVKHE
jgi:ribonucleoside-triphosphate reductase